MKKKYILPRIETVLLKLNHLMIVSGNEAPAKVKSLDTDAVSGGQQNDNNTLTESDVLL